MQKRELMKPGKKLPTNYGWRDINNTSTVLNLLETYGAILSKLRLLYIYN